MIRPRSVKSRGSDQPRAAPASVPGLAFVDPPAPMPLRISPVVLEASRQDRRGKAAHAAFDPYALPTPPPGVLPAGGRTMAMDDAIGAASGWGASNAGLPFGFGGGMGGDFNAQTGIFGPGGALPFMGYPYLAQLAQISEYRRPSEQIAKEMTRKWIRLTSTSKKDKTDKISALQTAMEKFRVRELFQRAAILDNSFGKALIYIDTGDTDNAAELRTPLLLDKAKIGGGKLKALTLVEPMWTYPAKYNSTEPLRTDFYKPTGWFTQGREVHSSRWLTFIGREVPDLAKPSYMFGGVSLSQLAKPYVDNWLQTRQAVSDLIASFSVSGILTSLQALLTGATDTSMFDRLTLFNNLRNNSGAMLLDKETEEFFNIATPLGTLDKLQAQAQEHMAAVFGTPLVVLLGITPAGLNPSSEGELEVWNTWVGAHQVHLFGQNLKTVIDILQLSECGGIDPDIGYQWEPLGELDGTAEAAIRKSDSDRAVALTGAGILSPEEERQRMADDEGSLYSGLDVTDVPEPPAAPGAGGEDGGDDGDTGSRLEATGLAAES